MVVRRLMWPSVPPKRHTIGTITEHHSLLVREAKGRALQLGGNSCASPQDASPTKVERYHARHHVNAGFILHRRARAAAGNHWGLPPRSRVRWGCHGTAA